MNIYTCNNFKGFWPVGTAAESKKEAKAKLLKELKKLKLRQDEDELIFEKVDTVHSQVIILNDGNY